jgi:hypothetical protein
VRVLVAAVVVLVATGAVAWADDSWTMVGATDVRYFNWNGNIGKGPFSSRSGDELYIPFTFGIYGRPSQDLGIELIGRGGWVNAEQTSVGLEGELGTITDSQLSATATYYGLKGIQPFISVGSNLPTGDPVLLGSDVNAIMNSNLVDIVTFGEGFNIGPSAGFNLPLGKNLIFTLTAGYTWRDSYDQSALLASTIPLTLADGRLVSIDPGESSSLTASLGYQKGQWRFTGSGSITHDTETTQNLLALNGISGWSCPATTSIDCTAILMQSQGKEDVALYQPGDRYFATGTLAYAWNGTATTTLTGAVSHSEKNDVNFVARHQVNAANASFDTITLTMTQTRRFEEEPFNSTGNFYLANFEHLFQVNEKFSIGPVGSFLTRQANDYAPGTLQYAPGATRWSAGGVMRYVYRNMTWTGRLEHVWLNTGAIPAPNGARLDLLSSYSCQSGPPVLAGEPSCNGNEASGVPVNPTFVPGAPIPNSSFTDWQGSIGLSIGF